MFRYDKGAKGIEWPMQVINNLSGGEIIQTSFGNSFAHYQNITGKIDRIGSFQGRTTVRVKSNSFGGYSGVSHGYYVFGENMALNPYDTDYELELFAHEFGHTYQSRISGPSYYFKYGISSALYADKSEDDADYRAHSNLGVWPHSRQTEPNRTKWWEYLFAPSIWTFMWNWN